MWKTTTDKKASALAGLAAGVAGAGSLGFVGAHVALAAALALPLGLLAAAIAVRLIVRGQPSLTEWANFITKIVTALRGDTPGHGVHKADAGVEHPHPLGECSPPDTGQRHAA
jgi:hypothetical protein